MFTIMNRDATHCVSSNRMSVTVKPRHMLRFMNYNDALLFISTLVDGENYCVNYDCDYSRFI